MFRRSSCSLAINRASMVLPTPTSSAISIRMVCNRKDIISGTIWYDRGRNESFASDRNGPAPLRNDSREASCRSRVVVMSPKSATVGLGNVVSSGWSPSKSSGRKIPVISSSEPPSGLTTKSSGSFDGSTTQSRPRRDTSLPGVNVVMFNEPC